jgi:hypothetical protein
MVYVERPATDWNKENPDICRVFKVDEDGNPERYANARLIAAAPDLLAALVTAADELETLHAEHYRTCKDQGPETCPGWAAIHSARAAIARATGNN